MTGYAKLFSSIVTSSIWTEDDRTRIVWITLLALADKHGEVHASIPGLARVAGVPLEACELAISKFLGPDQFSRTPDFDGRRIVAIDGGWEILNYLKYRRMASAEDRKEQTAERVRRHRERKGALQGVTVTHGNALLTLPSDNAECREQRAEVPQSPQAPDVELPHGFPKSENDAVVHADFVGCSREFASIEWHRSLGRGGRDSKDVPIRNWRGFLTSAFAASRDRKAESKAKPSDSSLMSAQLGFRERDALVKESESLKSERTRLMVKRPHQRGPDHDQRLAAIDSRVAEIDRQLS